MSSDKGMNMEETLVEPCLTAESVKKELVEMDDIVEAKKVLRNLPEIRRTPMLRDVGFDGVEAALGYSILQKVRVHLKLESTQTLGSFKIRGIANMCQSLLEEHGANKDDNLRLVTMSAGNFGKTFAYLTKKRGIPAAVCMPETAPSDRRKTISDFGARVFVCPTNKLMDKVARLEEEEGYQFVHPFDDRKLIAGYGTIGMELLEELPTLSEGDFILVPCGGGGVAAGIACAVKSMGCQAKVVAVEPEGAPCQFRSRQEGQAVKMPSPKTIAAGLAPPFAGELCFQHFEEFVDDIILVSDEAIKKAMRCLFDLGMVTEPSGAASFAALVGNRLEVDEGKSVVCVLTGRNISPGDFTALLTAA